MKRSLLIATLLIVSTINLFAQSLFTAPDTVCVKQKVYLKINDTTGSSFYWGFCSGYLANSPIGYNLGNGLGLNDAGAIDIAKSNGKYYAFIANRATNELLRLDFGAHLGNIPVVTSLGDIDGTLPLYTNSLQITQDTTGRWFMFACGGTNNTNASIARFDFATDLGNMPNGVNFGNLGGLLNAPRGISINYDVNSFNYYGFLVDSTSNELIRLNFGNDLFLTPLINSFGNVGTLAGPSDLESVYETGNWYLLATNQQTSTVSVITLGSTLAAIPAGINIGNVNNNLFEPTSLEVIKDCGTMYAFITNAFNSTLTKVFIPNISSPFSAYAQGNIGGMFTPNGLSSIIRDRDTLSMFAINNGDNSVSQILFPQCTDASRASDTVKVPKSYVYDAPGIYNIYLAVNEGKADMQIECQQIVVLPRPKVILSNDTVICQGDTIRLFTQSANVSKYVWSPGYNISDTLDFYPKVFPEYTLDYVLTLYYPNGCIQDTSVTVDVKKVKADAGVDRTLSDGAVTVLGGPNTTGPASKYFYQWYPPTYLDNILSENPSARPMHDMTYYLQVTLNDPLGCTDIDTVVVHVGCEELTLPNAFVPGLGDGSTQTFGLLNRQIEKLNYFRVFDRWGRVVFSTTDPAKQWDGYIDGVQAAVGVYIWEADGFCYNGNRVKKKGNVTLLR